MTWTVCVAGSATGGRVCEPGSAGGEVPQWTSGGTGEWLDRVASERGGESQTDHNGHGGESAVPEWGETAGHSWDARVLSNQGTPSSVTNQFMKARVGKVK